MSWRKQVSFLIKKHNEQIKNSRNKTKRITQPKATITHATTESKRNKGYKYTRANKPINMKNYKELQNVAQGNNKAISHLRS